MTESLFETERLRLRHYRLEDLDAIAAILGDPETMRYYPRPKTFDEAQAWIEWNLGLYAEHGLGLWAMELKETGEFVGNCGLVPQVVDGVDEIEVGYHVRRDLWGKGLAPEAAAASIDYGIDIFGLDRFISIINPENVPSQRVAEKIGMRMEKRSIVFDQLNLIYSMDIEQAA